MRAAAALPALFSSIKLIVEFTSSKTIIPRKSSQSGGMPCRCVSQSEPKCRGQGKTQSKNEQSKAEINNANYRFKHTCPLANTIAINAAASMTHDNGFHIKPRNLRNLFSCTTTT
jgi:hypothetical protein